MITIEIRRETITPQLREHILSRDKYTCRYCGNKREPFHIDHVYPVVKGGETSVNNLVTACKRCNEEKHAAVGVWPKPVGYFRKREIRLLYSTLILILWNVIGIYVISTSWNNVNPLILLVLFTVPSAISIYAQMDFFLTGKKS